MSFGFWPKLNGQGDFILSEILPDLDRKKQRVWHVFARGDIFKGSKKCEAGSP
jgi:hypothetical protein